AAARHCCGVTRVMRRPAASHNGGLVCPIVGWPEAERVPMARGGLDSGSECPTGGAPWRRDAGVATEAMPTGDGAADDDALIDPVPMLRRVAASTAKDTHTGAH